MFHLSDNLFFGRLPDGKVRVVKFAAPPKDWPQADGVFPDAVLDQEIDDGGWGSVVASMSAKGEGDGRWYKAMDFHHGRA